MDRTAWEKKYKSARANLLAAVLFSFINVMIIIFDTGYYFMFSVFMSTMFANSAMEDGALSIPWAVAAVACLLPFLLCWILSNKKHGWMTAALVLFSLDSLVFFLMIGIVIANGESVVSLLIDLLFHGWVLFYLIQGVRAAAALKKLPEEEIPAEAPPLPPGAPLPASAPLREPSAKRRLILQYQTPDGLHIELARARGVTELIVNSLVYAEFRGIVEPAYELHASVAGHDIKATMDIGALMELFVDRERVGKKHRFY